jgi:hypothetical protein
MIIRPSAFIHYIDISLRMCGIVAKLTPIRMDFLALAESIGGAAVYRLTHERS